MKHRLKLQKANNLLKQNPLGQKKEVAPETSSPKDNAANTANAANVANDSPAGLDPKIPNLANADEDVSNPNIIEFQDWVKFFRFPFAKGKDHLPQKFFRNPEYKEQMKKFMGLDLQIKAANGEEIFIPSESSFYATIFDDEIHFSTSRLKKRDKNFQILYIDDILPIIPGSPGKSPSGGLFDVGNFAEGSCLKIITKVEIYFICFDDDEQKVKMIDVLEQKQKKKRESKGLQLENTEKKEETIESLYASKRKSEGPKTNENVTDGHWLTLQDWSQCNKKCGTGVSTLQRICIPPKSGGKPCEGESLKTRPCNTEPCPQIKTEEQKSALTPVILKPITKIMNFSGKPQRYEKCFIKESDLMLRKTKDDLEYFNKETPNAFLMPVRVVMNLRTISIYQNAEDYTSLQFSFNIRTTTFFKSTEDKSCFILTESNHKKEFCPFGFGVDKTSKIIDEWEEAFDTFKNKCRKKSGLVEIDLERRLKEKMEKAKNDLMLERQKMEQEELNKDNKEEKEAVVSKTSQLVRKAIEKEEDMEALIEKEEEEKAELEEKELQEEIKKEEFKGECVVRAIKERELEAENVSKAKETELAVEEIKKTAQKEVKNKRDNFKKKVALIRNKMKGRTSRLQQKLMSIKLREAANVLEANKMGDPSTCKRAMESDKTRNQFCVANFKSEFIKVSECRETDRFCEFCCDEIFGAIHLILRESCKKKICSVTIEKEDKNEGSWIYAEKIKTK